MGGAAQLAFSLGWYIIIAWFGVGTPALMLFAEWWAKAMRPVRGGSCQMATAAEQRNR